MNYNHDHVHRSPYYHTTGAYFPYRSTLSRHYTCLSWGIFIWLNHHMIVICLHRDTSSSTYIVAHETHRSLSPPRRIAIFWTTSHDNTKNHTTVLYDTQPHDSPCTFFCLIEKSYALHVLHDYDIPLIAPTAPPTPPNAHWSTPSTVIDFKDKNPRHMRFFIDYSISSSCEFVNIT